MIRRGWRRAALCGLLLSTCGCSGSPMSPGATSVNVAGSWSGTLKQAGSEGGTTITVVWALTQVGNTVSGTETVSEPRRATVYSGTLTGTLNGDALSIKETVPQGHIPGFPACAISGSGILTASATSISGNLTAAFTACDGFNVLPDPGSVLEEFALTK